MHTTLLQMKPQSYKSLQEEAFWLLTTHGYIFQFLRHAQTVLQSSSQQQVLAHIAVLLQSEGGMILEQAEKQVFSIQAVKP